RLPTSCPIAGPAAFSNPQEAAVQPALGQREVDGAGLPKASDLGAKSHGSAVPRGRSRAHATGLHRPPTVRGWMLEHPARVIKPQPALLDGLTPTR
ncbi:MAG: hypothetical protein VX265_08050, partial [Myxococcota bacterium]|nr:hypothetical protein [Myxococcota bacterium]MEC8423448.1 hypothetical protein [Myxococcota bacterium]